MRKIIRLGSEVIKVFHTQLTIKFQMLIKTKMAQNKDFSTLLRLLEF